MIVLGIDPGPTTTGWAIWSTNERRVLRSANECQNADVLELLTGRITDAVVIERVQLYGGSPAGGSVFETAEWGGRFCQRALDQRHEVHWLKRPEVMKQLAGKGRAKKEEVRAALLGAYPGGKGDKYAPGPFFGVAGHAWSAAELAVAWAELHGHPEARLRHLAERAKQRRIWAEEDKAARNG